MDGRDPISSADGLAWAVGAFRDQALHEQYARFDRYYAGRHDFPGVATEKFREAFGRLFEDRGYNRCEAVVDAWLERLFVERFGFGLDAEREAGEEPRDARVAVEQASAAIWEANRMDTRQYEVHADMLILGDGYLLVWPDPETREPTMWPQKAREIRVRYDVEQPGVRLMAVKGWRQPDKRVRINTYHRDRIERWVTAKPTQAGSRLDPKQFVPFEEDALGPLVDNPYGEVPIFHFPFKARTGERGISLLRAVLPLQDYLNKTLIDMMIAEEFAAYPQRVLLGVEIDEDAYSGGDPLAAKHNANMLQRMAAGIDRMIAVAGEHAKIAEFSAAQLKQYDEVAEGWDRRISRVSRVPVHYLSMSGDFPSGRAMRTADAPFVAAVEKAAQATGNQWEDAQRFALRIKGIDYAGELEAIWKSPAPMASEDVYDLVLQMTTVGVPLELALEEAGWSKAKIERLKAIRQAEAEEGVRLAAEQFRAGRMPQDEDEDDGGRPVG